ncbi:MAG: DoxX family membrane protein [Bradyrhizobium sp.]|uniref:DoxX family membrane protein n=1 Tax=Bradyrhizobium sp. TaxID=376 RepID=UPI002389BE92|nr:DoxX family membrane protein [Bradyrhizobium sp.]MDE2069224.1 DoxX family membrane protein [Bradyrhizobium sp.]MDE2469718.1 DoxX family membrane protein [Bradyrhizobium sp.]
MTLTAISHDVDAQRREAVAVLIMRLTLGIFLLLWSVGKIVTPGATVRIVAHFYGFALPEAAPLLIGLAELALSLALLAGFARRLVYGLAIVLHATSTFASWRQLLDPSGIARPGDDLFLAGVPVLGAFIALYLLRGFDAYSLDEWLRTRRV